MTKMRIRKRIILGSEKITCNNQFNCVIIISLHICGILMIGGGVLVPNLYMVNDSTDFINKWVVTKFDLDLNKMVFM